LAKPASRAAVSTYRLQFRREFSFADAQRLVDYFEALGVSHLYASPVFKARPGSPHGYDVLDHSEVNPELGGEQGLTDLSRALAPHGMGLVLDLVPNHMCVASADNRWWADVLENGPASSFARYFDIDWSPPKEDLRDKVLLPILGDQYGRVLEKGEIRVERDGGTFFARYLERTLPLAPKSWTVILDPVRVGLEAGLAGDHPERVELESILTAISHLPTRSERNPEKVQERQREKEVIKRRLAALLDSSAAVREAVRASLDDLNGRPGDPRSFDRLEALLADQAYRLSHWQVATDEINYRRFFDINELAALRVEEPEVFEALHALPLRLAAEGIVSGFRIDHVDGLLDPADYLRRLPDDVYVVVEKVLVDDERLRPGWAGQGTTGYDYLNAAGALLVDPAGRSALVQSYSAFTGRPERFFDVVYECKKLVLEVALSAELTVLARRLDRISEQHRYSRDFTLSTQQEALAEYVACFPAYRSYVTGEGDQVSPEDRRLILTALRLARRRNPAMSASLFDFLGSVLLLDHPFGLGEPEREERRDFVRRLQQLTGPVMAKGLEDTASYRYYPLASLNEVGGQAEPRGNAVERFHAQNAERRRLHPLAMTATSTHDTKRDEDVRARISVLSEAPGAWQAALARWSGINRPLKMIEEEAESPDANDEYLFYQTLVGTWPPERGGPPVPAELVERLQGYMRKAIREAKVNTSWVNPNQPYERAVAEFVERVLDPAHPFLADFLGFLAPLLDAGLLNAVAQVVLKIASPGVPDFYQGTELPEFRLVDPDNRQPLDYGRRIAVLQGLCTEAQEDARALAGRLLAGRDGRLKLWVTSALLRHRRSHPALYLEGDYLALEPRGEQGSSVVAFARVHQRHALVVAAGRFFTRLKSPALGEAAWGETRLALPPGFGGPWHDVLTGHEVRATGPGASEMALASAFRHLPLALLEARA
jgi:(1->4)-alpha-D-glucan 1-alpha-D-glucosylmutase